MITKTLSTEPITGEDLFKMGDIGRCELVAGKIVRLPYKSARQGQISANIGSYLLNHTRRHQLGTCFASGTGIYTQRHPDTVRAPDAMYISNERLSQISDPAKFLDVAPDLAVEILSPNDTWTEVETKVAEYFQAGVCLIWIVDLDQNSITVDRQNGERSRLPNSDQLSGEEILPGFSVSITEIFE